MSGSLHVTLSDSESVSCLLTVSSLISKLAGTSHDFYLFLERGGGPNQINVEQCAKECTDFPEPKKDGNFKTRVSSHLPERRFTTFLLAIRFPIERDGTY